MLEVKPLMGPPKNNKRDPLNGKKTLKVTPFLEEFEKDPSPTGKNQDVPKQDPYGEGRATSSKDRLVGRKTLKVGQFLEEFEKDDIKAKVDIVELFYSFNVTLERRGSPPGKSFMGLCPFHEDHTPSLSVDREKGLYNCFGCGESGDAFDLVEKMKGLDFKGSLKFLKEWKGLSSYSLEPLPLKPVPVESISLNTIVDYYHKKLYDNPKALEYLEKRGLKNAGNYARFNIGFADGSILDTLSEAQKEALKESGILNDKGREHFINCLIFPIFDETGAADGRVVGLYGRDIDDSSSFKHRYIKGGHRGVFNRKASKVYDEIILTESIIDALSLIETGFENVQAIYGANGFTGEHLETLKSDRVKTVILALDNDEAGKRAASSIKERLINEGFRVRHIFPCYGLEPEVKDWNEALIAGKVLKEDIQVLIEQAAVFVEEKELHKDYPFKVIDNGLAAVFSFNDIPVIYRVAGLKETNTTSMRVNIRCEYGEASHREKYFDNLDLYSARSRFTYAQSLSRAAGLEMKRVEKDLALIVEYFDDEKERRGRDSQKEGKPEISEADRRIGMEFLKSPGIFKEIVNDMEVMGYVGEDLNKELLYLCASSRVMDDPISILILSESASGKSYLVDTVKSLMPAEDVVSVTSLSDQALNYMGNLLHKFLILGEAVHSDIIEHQIREMLSGKELSRLVTVKDEKTGKLESRLVRTPVIVSSVMSSTGGPGSHEINPENASRCFVINADESREQTRRIHEAQRRKYSLERYYEKERKLPEIIKKHQAAQRLLRNILIVNPFSKALGFPDNLMRTRRDNDRFLDLIACVSFLRQYQKTAKWEGPSEYIESDLEDYRIAYEIMVKGVLASSLLELPKGAAILYEEIRRMAREMADKNGIKTEEATFIQRDIREYSKFNSDSIKKYLKNLVDLEYVQIMSGRSRGTRLSYRLRKDEEMERIDLSAIPSLEEMAGLIKDGLNPESGEKEENGSKAL